MTDEDRKLTDLIARARAVAQPHGSMHAWWDTIFDAEALMAGQRQTLIRTKPAMIEKLSRLLAKR